MRKRYRYIVALLLAAILIGIFAWEYTFRKTALNVSSKKADYSLSATILLQEFENNETAANSLYLGKIISVTGLVESVSEDSLGISVYLKEVDAAAGVICSFDIADNKITSVERGNTVTIKGICTGYLMDVVMNRCSLESQ